jgi:hypothetical protein
VFWVAKLCSLERAGFSLTPATSCSIFGLLFDPEDDGDVCSSETSNCLQITGRYDPEDGALHFIMML